MQRAHPVAPPVDPVEPARAIGGKHRVELAAIGGGVLILLLAGAQLMGRAAHRANHVTLEDAPRPVTVAPAVETAYRDSRTYVGAVEPWIEANVGPQFVSAYVQTVLVRPGASVKGGDILATLDCSNPSASSQAVAMQARAVETRQRALADEAARVANMLDGGFVAPNEAEQKAALSSAEEAQVLETRAKLLSASLDVRDCVLRAPFDGEIAQRWIDPGAFVRPGAAIVSIVDRRTVRVTIDAPEKDFDALPPEEPVRIRMLATGAELTAPIARRAPKADPKTRTIHVEIDVPDPDRRWPVGTTAIVSVDVGAPVRAVAIPLYAAIEEHGKAKVFVVDAGVAHARTVPVLGESGGLLYLDPNGLAPDARVVSEGRALLSDGDRVEAHLEPAAASNAVDGGADRGGGFGRPL